MGDAMGANELTEFGPVKKEGSRSSDYVHG